MTKTLLIILVLAALVPAVCEASQSASATSTPAVDRRWLPWLGCWQPLDETVQEDTLRVCVVPADSSGVTIQTVSANRVVLGQTIVVGAPRPVDDPACPGTQHADWSKNGRRLLTRAELTCDAEPSQNVAGVMTITPKGIWLDIQVATRVGHEDVRVVRYRRAGGSTLSARELSPDVYAQAASAPQTFGAPTIDEVIELTPRVPSSALETLLLETNARFPIDKHALLTLEAARVAAPVIDVMVALSYPEHFVVQRPARTRPAEWPTFSDAAWSSPWLDFYPYFAYYSPLGYLDPYYRSGVYGLYESAAISGSAAASGANAAPAAQDARVVNGRGYTRIAERPSTPSDATATRTPTRTGSSAGAPASQSSDGSGGSVTSQGYSGGGASSSGGSSGGDSGRTAHPR